MVYDCFPFFNELDLLKIRLEMMDDVVDKFVLVEASKTQKGDSKPYYFDEAKEQFSKWNQKIIHIKVDDLPELDLTLETLDWSIEFFQRDCILRGLVACKPDDIVIISDLDEFIHPDIIRFPEKYKVCPISEGGDFKDKVKQVLRMLGTHATSMRRKVSLQEVLDVYPVVVQQDFCYYFMNTRSPDIRWYGSIISKYKNMSRPQFLRNKRNRMPYVKNGGWHFSYLGGRESVKKKLASIIEGDTYKMPKKFDSIDEYVEHYIQNGLDMYENTHFDFVETNKLTIPNVELIAEQYPHLFKNKIEVSI